MKAPTPKSQASRQTMKIFVRIQTTTSQSDQGCSEDERKPKRPKGRQKHMQAKNKNSNDKLRKQTATGQEPVSLIHQ